TSSSPVLNRASSGDQRIQLAIRLCGFLQNHCHFVLLNGWLVLCVHLWNVDKAIVPISLEKWFAFYVPRRGYNGFDDIHVIANGRRRQRGNMINELFHGEVGDVGQIPLTEEGIHPLVQGVSPCVDRRLFKGITFAVGEGLEPDFTLLLEGNVCGALSKGLYGIDAEFLEVLRGLSLCDCTRAADTQRDKIPFEFCLPRNIPPELHICRFCR